MDGINPHTIHPESVTITPGYEFFIFDSTIGFLLGGVLAASYLVYYLYFVPLSWNREPTEITYNFATSGVKKVHLKRDIINRTRRLRKVGEQHLIPPPFPNGWYALLESKDLKVGHVVEVTCLGQHFAVFRTDLNKVRVLEAYCPHMGANLAIGGKVIGDSIQCPFHEWSFSGADGQCINIPYSSCEIGAKTAKLKKWISRETNGAIFVWYHAENEQPWDLPVVEEIETKQFVYHGRNEFTVHCHIQEIPENGADLAHFAAVHGDSLLGGSEPKGKLRSLLGTHSWKATWKADIEPKHTAIVNLKHSMILDIGRFGIHKLCQMDVSGKQIGPAYVQMHMVASFGPIVVIQTVTPMEPLVQKVIHRFYAPRSAGPFIKFLILAESIMFERDMSIWNHKAFTNSPCLVKEDKTIRLYRNWFTQFYSENSRSFVHAKESLDW